MDGRDGPASLSITPWREALPLRNPAPPALHAQANLSPLELQYFRQYDKLLSRYMRR